MDKYLITGFSGFVGYHFINVLNSHANEKIKVLGLDIAEPFDFSSWNYENLDISFISVNLLDSDKIYQILVEYKPTHILHLAALSSVGLSWKDPSGCFLNNTTIFLNIVEVLRRESICCKLLCIGSSEEYGFVKSGDIPICESLSINPESPYAVTKVAQEGMSKCYVAKYGMNITLTRSFNHIGPRQRDSFVISSFCKQIAEAYTKNLKEFTMVTGNLDIIRDFLDVRDVVEAYYLILQTGKPGELYNVCSGIGYALKDIISILSDISQISITTKINPDFLRPNDMPMIIGNNEKLKKDTEWYPKYNIKQSLTDIFNYWVEQLKK